MQRRVIPLKMIRLEVDNQVEVIPTQSTQGAKAGGLVEIYNCHPSLDLIINSDTNF